MKGLSFMPAALTVETSFAAMGRDMGSSHIKAHANQHKYLAEGEEPVDYLLPNDETTSIVKQAIKVGVESGQLRSETEWKKYNKGLRKDRRLDSYQEYVQKTYSTASQKVYRNLDKALQDSKTPKAKKSLIATEYSSLASHEDLPIIGSLYYFGDVSEFEDAKKDGYFDQLKRADKMAGDLFFKSKEFKCLHPQVFKLERHQDEAGRPHLQSMEACFITYYRDYKTKSGTVRRRIDGYGKTQYQMNGLVKYFGSKSAVEQQLDRLIELQQQSQNQIKKNNGQRIGLERPEASMLMDNFDQQEAKRLSTKIQQDVKPKSLERLRRQTIAQLFRVVDFSAMSKAKKEAYEKCNLPAKYSKTTITYTTDGKHLTAHQYRLKMAAKDAGKGTIEKAKAVANQTKKAAKDDADIIIKAAKKKAKRIVDDAQAKQAEAEQQKNETLYDQAKVAHQVHLAKQRLADLNKQANNQENELNQQQKKHDQFVEKNDRLTKEIEDNQKIIKSVNGLQQQAKIEGLSVNDVIADRSKLLNRIRLMGQAFAIMERTAKLAISLMTGQPIAYKDNNKYKDSSSDRAFADGITLENYNNQFTTIDEKRSMANLPIILARKAEHWLARKYEAKFHQSPYLDKQERKELQPNIKQAQNTDEHTLN